MCSGSIEYVNRTVSTIEAIKFVIMSIPNPAKKSSMNTKKTIEATASNMYIVVVLVTLNSIATCLNRNIPIISIIKM